MLGNKRICKVGISGISSFISFLLFIPIPIPIFILFFPFILGLHPLPLARSEQLRLEPFPLLLAQQAVQTAGEADSSAVLQVATLLSDAVRRRRKQLHFNRRRKWTSNRDGRLR